MKVEELAKEFNIEDAVIAQKLKALKMKAKDGELNRAVAIVLRGELAKDIKSGKIKIGRKEVVAAKAPVVKETKKEIVSEKKTKAKPKKTEASATSVKKEETKQKKVAPPKEKIEEPSEVKTVQPVVEKVEKSAEIKLEKKTPEPITEAPFVALKPLPKKRKKMGGEHGGEHRSGFGGEHAAATPTPSGIPGSGVALPGQPGLGSTPSATVDVPTAPALKPLEIELPMAVKDFAVSIQEKVPAVLKKLLQMGILTHINQHLDEDVLRPLAKEFGYELKKIKTQEERLIAVHLEEEDDPALLKARAPVVTFMGHVDHGKTSLLDRIRRARVAESEHGGITQHIGAYSVKLPKGRITFLDTPGHEAFTAMRARGAHITDIVVLVVAADEGLMPQTMEAIDHARAANVPIVVALNKIDKASADPERVKKQLAQNDLTPEDWGGKTIVAGVSAHTGEGIDNLLELILLEAELLELKANAAKSASGIVVEAHLSRGKGAMASLIVQSGTLHLNDVIVVGPYYGKVKALFDDLERHIKEAGPSMPVEILGLPGVPEAGEKFYVLADERQAREIAKAREEQLKKEKLASSKKITLEDLYLQIQDGKVKELNIILKADVQGSLEAIQDALVKIPSDEVKVRFVHKGVGDINASDVILAFASKAIIMGFQVGVGDKARDELEKQPVDVRQYRIIYDAVNDIRKALEGLLDPKLRRKFIGRVEVRQVFKLSKSGLIAGCFVQKGRVNRKVQVDVLRNGQSVHSGTIQSLKRFKDDVKEVLEGFECGIAVSGFTDYQPGDILEVFETESIARTLKES